MNERCVVCQAIMTNKYIIFDTEHWIVSLASDQSFLGRSYVTVRNHTSSLSELSNEQWNDLHESIKRFERAVTAAFGANLFNWACLMNDSFKDPKRPQPTHVHFHVRPRYKDPIMLADNEFIDRDFGRHHRTRWDGATSLLLDDTKMLIIQKSIQKCL